MYVMYVMYVMYGSVCNVCNGMVMYGNGMVMVMVW